MKIIFLIFIIFSLFSCIKKNEIIDEYKQVIDYDINTQIFINSINDTNENEGRINVDLNELLNHQETAIEQRIINNERYNDLLIEYNQFEEDMKSYICFNYFLGKVFVFRRDWEKSANYITKEINKIKTGTRYDLLEIVKMDKILFDIWYDIKNRLYPCPYLDFLFGMPERPPESILEGIRKKELREKHSEFKYLFNLMDEDLQFKFIRDNFIRININ